MNYISKDKLLLFNRFQSIMPCFSNTAHLCNILQYIAIFKWNIAIYRNIVFTRDTHPYWVSWSDFFFFYQFFSIEMYYKCKKNVVWINHSCNCIMTHKDAIFSVSLQSLPIHANHTYIHRTLRKPELRDAPCGIWHSKCLYLHSSHSSKARAAWCALWNLT